MVGKFFPSNRPHCAQMMYVSCLTWCSYSSHVSCLMSHLMLLQVSCLMSHVSPDAPTGLNLSLSVLLGHLPFCTMFPSSVSRTPVWWSPITFWVLSVSSPQSLLVPAHLESLDACPQWWFSVNITSGELWVSLGHQTTAKEVLESGTVSQPDTLLALDWNVSSLGKVWLRTHHKTWARLGYTDWPD